MPKLKFHPIADIFPLLEGEAFERFVEDIKVNGQINPAVVLDGHILDGRNRARACEKLKIELLTEDFPGGSVRAFVISENLQRMHLTESQRGIVASRLANLKPGRQTGPGAGLPEPEPPVTQADAAALLDVGERTVRRGTAVLEKGVPELVSSVEDGTVTLKEAERIIKIEDPAEQTIAVAKAKKKKSHVSNNSQNDEWFTPEVFIEAVREVLGEIDLDPASNKAANEAVVHAKKYFSLENSGLEQEWKGRVFMNPPYSNGLIAKFIQKLVDAEKVSEAIVLTNNATETKWSQLLQGKATALCFPKARIKFWFPGRDSFTPLQGQMFYYLGENVDKFCDVFDQFGTTWVK